MSEPKKRAPKKVKGEIVSEDSSWKNTPGTGSDSFPSTSSNQTAQTTIDSEDSGSSPPLTTNDTKKKPGGDRISSESSVAAGSAIPESLALARERLPGETKSACKERLRMLARNAGLPRGTGPGTAYEWAMHAVLELFAPKPPEPTELTPEQDDTVPVPEKSSEPEKSVAVQPAPQADLGVSGLSDVPESWPELPANAQLQVEIAWVTANRLRVRRGTGVDLSKALSPAPSYSALSWLETSILFPAKFADISVKATAEQDDEKEFVRREKLAIEEIRSILKEMLDARAE